MKSLSPPSYQAVPGEGRQRLSIMNRFHDHCPSPATRGTPLSTNRAFSVSPRVTLQSLTRTRSSLCLVFNSHFCFTNSQSSLFLTFLPHHVLQEERGKESLANSHTRLSYQLCSIALSLRFPFEPKLEEAHLPFARGSNTLFSFSRAALQTEREREAQRKLHFLRRRRRKER